MDVATASGASCTVCAKSRDIFYVLFFMSYKPKGEIKHGVESNTPVGLHVFMNPCIIISIKEVLFLSLC